MRKAFVNRAGFLFPNDIYVGKIRSKMFDFGLFLTCFKPGLKWILFFFLPFVGFIFKLEKCFGGSRKINVKINNGLAKMICSEKVKKVGVLKEKKCRFFVIILNFRLHFLC